MSAAPSAATRKRDDALKALPASIVERERAFATRLVALSRQKARNEIKNWQPLAG